MKWKDSTLTWKKSHEADVTNLHPSLSPKFTLKKSHTSTFKYFFIKLKKEKKK